MVAEDAFAEANVDNVVQPVRVGEGDVVEDAAPEECLRKVLLRVTT